MFKKTLLSSMLLIAAVSFLFAGGTAEQQSSTAKAEEIKDITVFNAASTTDLINEIGDLFQEETGIVVKTNPASSGTLAHQIEEGAEAEVYIAASKKWMDYVEELGAAQEVSPFVKNRLVLIAPSDSPLESFELSQSTDFASLFSGRLSMGDPAHVPAGKYAEEALQNYGWYEQIADRILPATDVRAALSVVEMGETELGIVYETDAKKSDKVKIISRFPEDSHTPIEYFCAVLKDSNAKGKTFYDFLLNDADVDALYTKYGFSKAE